MVNSVDSVGMLKKIIDSEALLLSIGDVANAVDVSTRQLRYWEKKGYIKSKVSKTGQRKYTYFTMIQAGNIANFMAQGYTLAMSAEKAQKNGMIMKQLRHFLQKRFSTGRDVEDGYMINLGTVKGLPDDQNLYINISTDGENYFEIKPAQKIDE
jgi:DNA-binding transcriptional MerR regulator